MDSDQDLEIEIIDKDSGMSSAGGSKDDTPERRVIIVGSQTPCSLIYHIFCMLLSVFYWT